MELVVRCIAGTLIRLIAATLHTTYEHALPCENKPAKLDFDKCTSIQRDSHAI